MIYMQKVSIVPYIYDMYGKVDQFPVAINHPSPLVYRYGKVRLISLKCPK
jgi:hypothetical protein